MSDKLRGALAIDEDDWQQVLSAVENLRAAPMPEEAEHRAKEAFRAAYNLEQFAKRMYAALNASPSPAHDRLAAPASPASDAP